MRSIEFAEKIAAVSPAERAALVEQAWDAEAVAYQKFLGGGTTPQLRDQWQRAKELRVAVVAAVKMAERVPANTGQMRPKKTRSHTLIG